MIPLWSEMRRGDFDDLSRTRIAVLPLGATEQHGPHLPFCVDTTLTEAVLARTDTSAHALQLPTLAITKSDEHAAHAGTLTLSTATLLATLRDITASVARAVSIGSFSSTATEATPPCSKSPRGRRVSITG